MGLMDSVIRSDGEFAADTDQFGEAVTYTRAAGTTTTPTVIVDRSAPANDPDYDTITRVFDVWIAYDATDTFGLSSPPAKGDKITLKNDPSDAGTVVKQFHAIVTTDTGGWLAQFVGRT